MEAKLFTQERQLDSQPLDLPGCLLLGDAFFYHYGSSLLKSAAHRENGLALLQACFSGYIQQKLTFALAQAAFISILNKKLITHSAFLNNTMAADHYKQHG